MGGYIKRISGEVADIILRDGIDYIQIKAVFFRLQGRVGKRLACGHRMKCEPLPPA